MSFLVVCRQILYQAKRNFKSVAVPVVVFGFIAWDLKCVKAWKKEQEERAAKLEEARAGLAARSKADEK